MADLTEAFVISLGLDTGELDAGVAKVEAAIQQLKARLQQQGSDLEHIAKDVGFSMSTVTTGLSRLFGVYLSFEGLKNLITDTVAADAAIGNLAKSVGESSETISTWENAFKSAGGDAGEFDSAIKRMSQELVEFNKLQSAPMPEWATAMARYLGIKSPAQLAPGQTYGQKIIEDIKATSEAVHRLFPNDPTKANSYITQTLGITNDANLRLIREGGDNLQRILDIYQKYAVTNADVENAYKIQEALAQVEAAIGRIGNDIMNDISEPLKNLSTNFILPFIKYMDTVVLAVGAIETAVFGFIDKIMPFIEDYLPENVKRNYELAKKAIWDRICDCEGEGRAERGTGGGQATPAKPGEPSTSKETMPSTGTADVDKAIQEAASASGVDVNTMRAIASIESSMQPESNKDKATQYKGLYQIGREEWATFGTGDIYNPADNAMAAARMFKAHIAQFETRFGRKPTDQELYMIHQQGLGFFTRGAMTNIEGNAYPGMAGAQTQESFMAGWGRELARRKARFESRYGTQTAVAPTPAEPVPTPVEPLATPAAPKPESPWQKFMRGFRGESAPSVPAPASAPPAPTPQAQPEAPASVPSVSSIPSWPAPAKPMFPYSYDEFIKSLGPVSQIPTGGTRTAMGEPVQHIHNNNENETHVNSVIVHSSATDAHGIAKDINEELQRQMA